MVMNIVPELNLNKHPVLIKNNAIVEAHNIMLSKDNAVLQNENLLESIGQKILDNNGVLNVIESPNIIYALPCNKEILFFHLTEEKKIIIIRYNEDKQQSKIVLKNLEYHNGKLLGSFTYNKGNLIITLSEYDGDIDVPLKTINFGSWNDDINQELAKLPLIPEVKLPYVTNEYVNGKFYKGWYSTYIRYKINDDDYTQWYSIGIPFVLDAINNQTVVKAITNMSTSETDDNFKFSGFANDFNSNDDFSKDTVKITLDGLDNRYSFYQISVIKKSTTSTNSYVTSDINIEIQDLIIDSSLFKEYNINELLKTYYNYYNVKALDNINNRLYIANYKERNNLLDVNADNVAKINLKLQVSKLQIHDDIESTSELYNNIFTKKGRRTYTSINKQGIISFKEYCKQSGITDLQQIANATDDTIIFFIAPDASKVNSAPLHTLYIQVGDETPTGHYLYCNVDNNISSIYKANDETVIYINGKDVFNQKIFKLSLLENYSCESTEFDDSYILQDHRYVIRNNTLLAGEVYNFYIHYVDKYGHATDGYKIPYVNPTKIILDDEEVSVVENINVNDIVPVLFIYGASYYKVLVKANSLCIDETSFITDSNGNLYIFNATAIGSLFVCATQYTGFDGVTKNVIESIYSLYTINENDIWANVIENYTNNGIKQNILNGIIFDFLPFINNNNEILHRIPNIVSIYDSTINLIKLIADNINIPSDYVGWFISYEKLETRKKINGFINLNKTKESNVYFNKEDKKVNIYTDEINIKENINLDVNKIRLIPYSIKKGISIEGEKSKISNYNYFFYKTTMSENEYLFYKEYLIEDIEVIWADTVDNYNRSSHINITFNSFPDSIESHQNDDDENFIYCELYSTSRNIYIEENKTLYRLTNIYNKNINKPEIIETISGNISFDTAIIYDYRGVMVDDTYGKLIPFDEEKSYNNDFLTYAISFFNFPNYSSYIKELKTYNNEPTLKIVPYWIATDNNSNTRYIDTKIVIPVNSLNLWKNDFMIDKDIKIYSPFNKNFINNFPNTIRRSNTMQDESNINAWRYFNTEEYKNIVENKGNIVKLIGIGKYFIVHTEHSIFLFNATDTIKSNEGNIQLASVDIMSLNYQEVITSKLGHAGIQKEHQGIVGTFGYIFYSIEDKRLYKYDNNSLIVLDEFITNYINEIEVTDVEFIDDKYRNRLLIKFIKNNTILYDVLSYNYNSNSFISKHNHDIIKGYSTKNNCYIITSNGDIKDFNAKKWSNASISIFNNLQYELMKYLDSIIYKVNKINNNILVNTESPVEGKDIHYASNSLQIYSEHCDTGVINIDTSKNLNSPDNYMTPYWRFGNWHFNAIRNKVTDDKLVADEKSRIFGNWFVVKFEFDTNDKVEIETLECKTSIAEY